MPALKKMNGEGHGLVLGEDARELGNRFFRMGKYRESIESYTKAIQRGLKDARLFTNRAAAHMKMDSFSNALQVAYHFFYRY